MPHLLTRPTISTSRALGAERGFTLVELLVVMASGILVASALFTILDVTLHQTTRTFSRVDATQRARNVLERIENEMHSACVANDVRPIFSGSTDTSVSFWSGYGNAVNVTPLKRTISFDSTTGKLTESVYPLASGTSPSTWQASATPSSTETLLTNVAQSGSTPVFQYYELTEPGNTLPLQVPLTADGAENASEVGITLVVKPTGGTHQNVNLAANTVTNSVLLRLTPISNPDGQAEEFPPCA